MLQEVIEVVVVLLVFRIPREKDPATRFYPPYDIGIRAFLSARSQVIGATLSLAIHRAGKVVAVEPLPAMEILYANHATRTVRMTPGSFTAARSARWTAGRDLVAEETLPLLTMRLLSRADQAIRTAVSGIGICARNANAAFANLRGTTRIRVAQALPFYAIRGLVAALKTIGTAKTQPGAIQACRVNTGFALRAWMRRIAVNALQARRRAVLAFARTTDALLSAMHIHVARLTLSPLAVEPARTTASRAHALALCTQGLVGRTESAGPSVHKAEVLGLEIHRR